jgi:biopolymer transport protein ExbB
MIRSMSGRTARWKRFGSYRPSFTPMAILALLFFGSFEPSDTLAQEAPASEVEAPAATAVPSNPADPIAGNNESNGDISYLDWAARSLGWFYGLVFLGLSFTLVALFVMNTLTARRDNVVPSDLVDGFEQQLNARQFQEAYELAKSDDSLLGHVLSAGLGKVSSGYNQAIEAMQEVGEEENMRLEHRLSYLALIGTLCPMIGLLGTVSGMIDSFKLIANTASGAPDPQMLAQGISTALFTTFVGLALAIPALAAYNLLRNRVARLVLEVGIVSEGLMSRFQNTGEKPAAGA